MFKNLKTRIFVILTACTLALCGGWFSFPFITTYAEEAVESVESVETPETSVGNGEISNDIVESEESLEVEENASNLWTESTQETITEEEIDGIVKQAFEKAKNWLVNTYAWIIGIGGGGVLTLLLSIFWKLISKKINRSNNLTEDKVDEIATKAVEKAVSKIVGKSLNVDIQAEVSESVKTELAPMIRNMQVAMESAKNAEVGTAMVMKAQAKSRLISDEETAEIEARAASLLAHAEKFGGLSVPIQIQTELKGEEKTERETVNLVETPNKPKEKKENESYISF